MLSKERIVNLKIEGDSNFYKTNAPSSTLYKGIYYAESVSNKIESPLKFWDFLVEFIELNGFTIKPHIMEECHYDDELPDDGSLNEIDELINRRVHSLKENIKPKDSRSLRVVCISCEGDNYYYSTNAKNEEIEEAIFFANTIGRTMNEWGLFWEDIKEYMEKLELVWEEYSMMTVSGDNESWLGEDYKKERVDKAIASKLKDLAE